MEQWSELLSLVTAFQPCRETNTLLRTLVTHLGPVVGAGAVLVWMRDPEREDLVCLAYWSEPGSRIEPASEPTTEGLLPEVLEGERARRLSAEEVDPEALLHLAERDRERVKTALYSPLFTSKGPVGVLEILNKQHGEFTVEDEAFVEEACRITGRALDALEAIEQERQSDMATVERLTVLYDISRVFGSTLELSELLPIAAEKIRDTFGAAACTLWLVDSAANELYFAHQAGEDPTTSQETRIPLGEGLLGQVAERGEPRLVENAEEEPLLEDRRQASEEFALTTFMYAPLVKGDQVLGVAEVVNKQTGEPFDEDDLFFLSSVAEQAAIALNNANLLNAERKVHELDALLATSKELTSTLDLDHVLTTVVHQAATVVPFDLCAIGLFDRSQFVLGAVSGESEVPRTPKMEQLRGILEWVAGQEAAVAANRHGEDEGADQQDVPEDLTRFLAEHAYNGFYALPLRDDQGTVGVLALLSSESDFLSENHLEVLSILASQTTVAVRNARLYQEVPLASIWQPLLKGKRRLEGVSHGRWLEIGWKAGVVALVLVAVPWKLRIQTNAMVIPAQRRVVTAKVSGVIQRVLVREGQRVAAGETLATLDASDNQVRLDRALTDLGLARQQLAEAEAKRDWAAASQAHLAMDLHQAEVSLYREKVEEAQIRATITGVVVTPRVEEKIGKLLQIGDPFCELVDQEHMAVEMNVPESDVYTIQPQAPVALKLNAFPTRTIIGRVERVSAQSVSAEGEQFFVTRAIFPTPGGRVRTGMAGQAKITAAGGWFHSGWYPVGYVLLRTPTRWAWGKAWSWLP
jgi:RND family efflux transporter MFP subunit